MYGLMLECWIDTAAVKLVIILHDVSSFFFFCSCGNEEVVQVLSDDEKRSAYDCCSGDAGIQGGNGFSTMGSTWVRS